MKHAKIRSIIAFIGLGCMAVFTPILIAIFAFPQLAKGPLGWVALVTGLIGVGICIAVRFLFKGDKKEKPSYLPAGAEEEEKPEKGKDKKPGKPRSDVSESENSAETEGGETEGNGSEE